MGGPGKLIERHQLGSHRYFERAFVFSGLFCDHWRLVTPVWWVHNESCVRGSSFSGHVIWISIALFAQAEAIGSLHYHGGSDLEVMSTPTQYTIT